MARRDMEARAVITAKDNASATFRRIAGEVQRLEGASARVGRASGAVTRGSATALAALTRFAAPAALAAGAVAASRNFATYDRQLSYLANTANATEEQMAGVRDVISTTSREVAEAPQDVLKGTQTFIAALGDLDTAAKATRETARAAKAFGTDIEDQAAAGVAVIQNLGIEVERLNRANEIMAAGANIGMFEAKDMAKHLPSIAAAAKELKVAGDAGLAKLVTHLEVARTATGDSATAANDYYNLLSKIVAPQTIKNVQDLAKNMGRNVDLTKEIEKGYRNGTDAIDTFLRVVRELSRGDPSKIKELIPDMQANRALTALLSQYDQLDDKLKVVLNSAGLVDKAFSRVMNDAQSGFDRLSAAWERWEKMVGRRTGADAAAGALAAGLDESARVGEMTPEQRAAFLEESNQQYRRSVIAGDANTLRETIKQRTETRKAEIDAEVAAIEKQFAGVDPQAAPMMAQAMQEANARKWRLKVEKAAIEGDGTDEIRALRMRLFEAEQRLRQFDALPLPAPGGMVPARAADAEDRAAARQAAIDHPVQTERRPRRGNVPLPAASPIRTQLPPVGDDAGGFSGGAAGMGALPAVVQGPVTATVTGDATVRVQVDVTASPELRALARAADTLLQLKSDARGAPTGRSLPEAAPPTGRGSW